jgi:REP element-mobilizing transposase RayT
MSSDIHHRRSIRLQGYDYAQAGAYFVTICTQNRECFWGKVVDGEMVLNDAGQMVKAVWDSLPSRFPFIELDQFCVMPNHVHGIVVLTGHRSAQGHHPPHAPGDHQDRPYNPAGEQSKGRGASCIRPTTSHHPPTGDHQDRPYATVRATGDHKDRLYKAHGTLEGTVARVIQAFKSITIYEYIMGVRHHEWRPFEGRLWQRNYYEHIIRNEDSLNRIREYIATNPLRWELDRENPQRTGDDEFDRWLAEQSREFKNWSKKM